MKNHAIEYIGLTPEAENAVHQMYFAGVYEYTFPDGESCYLRQWRSTRFPVTCSVGGAIEVPQLYIPNATWAGSYQIFTALISDMNFYMLEIKQVPSELGEERIYDPIWKYNAETGKWTLSRPIPLRCMDHVWQPDESGKSQWDTWRSGTLPKELFEKNAIKELINA